MILDAFADELEKLADTSPMAPRAWPSPGKPSKPVTASWGTSRWGPKRALKKVKTEVEGALRRGHETGTFRKKERVRSPEPKNKKMRYFSRDISNYRNVRAIDTAYGLRPKVRLMPSFR